MRWDVFCTVVDNHGDLGVCWRLAQDLCRRGETVRLWVDQPDDLDWMAPADAVHCAVEVRPWTDAEKAVEPGEVVVEAFACNPPAAFVARMQRPRPPVWINLEYLSAEDHVDRSHRLPSPVMHGPGRGLTKFFFFPGFTPASGGLLREPGLMAQRDAWTREPWLARHACAPRADETVIGLFCYVHAPLPSLLDWIETSASLVLVAAGQPRRAVEAHLGRQLTEAPSPPVTHGSSRLVALPYLPQVEFDHLLWSCDLNFVRGEDSLVRAHWAGSPFVWQAYRQDADAHLDKVDALLERMTGSADRGGSADASLRAAWQGWNGRAGSGNDLARWLAGWRDWALLTRRWRQELLAQDDLVTRLMAFADAKAGPSPS